MNANIFFDHSMRISRKGIDESTTEILTVLPQIASKSRHDMLKFQPLSLSSRLTL